MNKFDENKEVKASAAPTENMDEFGAHPISTLIGAASGAGASTLAGAVMGGPAGAVAGAIFGAVAGGIAGNDIAEAINPTIVEEYWEEHYTTRPYTRADTAYDYYRSAYKFGYAERVLNPNKKFSESEESLRAKWNASEYAKNVNWETAKEPVRDAFETDEAVYDKRTDSFIVKPRTKVDA